MHSVHRIMKETTFYCDKEIIVIIILLWKVWYKGCGTAPCIKKIPLFVQCLSVPMLFWLVMASPSHLSAPTFCLPSLLKAKNGGKSLLYLINKQPGIIIQLILNNDDSKNALKICKYARKSIHANNDLILWNNHP